MSIDPKVLFPILENTGESQVRIKLAQGVYGEEKIPIVYEWLRIKDEERINLSSSRNKAAALEQLRIASSAKNAAWIAAIAAIIAAATTIFVVVK
ncbi:hypothetical protein KKC91_04985 [bacterium]|nr:hypothetical protein [bacterium]